MTLAAIFLVSVFSALSAPPSMARHPIAQQEAPASKTPETAAKQDQPTAPAQNPVSSQPPSSPVSPAQTSPSHSAPAAQPPHHKKRVRPPNCGTMPTSGQAASGSTSAQGDPATAPEPATASPATNCPPPKVIVRQGGTSEPSIQLAGGPPPSQTSNQRDTANQMLDATEANLKKIAGKQLTVDQQNMVNQTRQFIQQSKAAVEAGDLERARTLAWKAQVLSEELVKPEK
jgi:hypothetical protein